MPSRARAPLPHGLSLQSITPPRGNREPIRSAADLVRLVLCDDKAEDRALPKLEQRRRGECSTDRDLAPPNVVPALRQAATGRTNGPAPRCLRLPQAASMISH